ncbi:unnamed protein product, partial [Rotaria magnacalcarata]
PETKVDDLTKIYDEKLRLLRTLKPELFDSQGNLISRNPPRTYSYSQASEPSSKKYLRNLLCILIFRNK